MRLLDFMSDDNPRGLLGLHLLAAAGPQATPASFGQRLLGGVSGYRQEMTAAEERRMKKALQEGQLGLLGAQLDETKAQAKQREAAARKAEQEAAEFAMYRQDLQGPSPQQALMGGGGPTVGNAAMMNQAPDFAALARKYPMLIDQITKQAAAQDLGVPQVARTIEGRDERGQPTTLQFDNRGRQIGPGIPQWKAPVQMDTGGATNMLDPVTMQMLAQFQKTQTPDSKASNAIGWANNALSAKRLNFDMQQPKGQFDPERGLMIDPRTGVATPVTQNGQPIGPKNKELNDAQAKALLFGTRMQESDKVIAKLAAGGTSVSIPGSRAGYGIGPTINAISPASLQQLDQAKRDFINATLRRESGAVISPSEFENAEKQYFPQVGDGDEVKAQKARNRDLATRAILIEVPENRRGSLAPSAPASGSPSLADIDAELRRRGGR